MPKRKKVSQPLDLPKNRPAISPEARVNQLIALAYDVVEQRLRDNTATSQETSTLLKLGTEKAKLEKEKLERENMLLKAKTESIESARTSEELYAKAIKAMSEYSGHPEMADDIEVFDE